MIEKKIWQEFRDAGLLWWINRLLHTFGWAIVVEVNADDSILDVYPARVKFRGFHEQLESDGFVKLTRYLSRNIYDLERETNE